MKLLILCLFAAVLGAHADGDDDEDYECNAACANCTGKYWGHCSNDLATAGNEYHGCTECAVGYYDNSGSCEDCDPSCDSSGCTGGTDGDCIACADGYYNNTGIVNSGSCDECAGDNVATCDENGGSRISWTCDPGYYKSAAAANGNDDCAACGGNMATCDDNGDALTCDSGYYRDGGVADTCTKCGDNEASCNTNGDAQSCDSGYYVTGGNTCAQCDPSCAECDGPTDGDCTKCFGDETPASSFWLDNGVCKECNTTDPSCADGEVAICGWTHDTICLGGQGCEFFGRDDLCRECYDTNADLNGTRCRCKEYYFDANPDKGDGDTMDCESGFGFDGTSQTSVKQHGKSGQWTIMPCNHTTERCSYGEHGLKIRLRAIREMDADGNLLKASGKKSTRHTLNSMGGLNFLLGGNTHKENHFKNGDNFFTDEEYRGIDAETLDFYLNGTDDYAAADDFWFQTVVFHESGSFCVNELDTAPACTISEVHEVANGVLKFNFGWTNYNASEDGALVQVEFEVERDAGAGPGSDDKWTKDLDDEFTLSHLGTLKLSNYIKKGATWGELDAEDGEGVWARIIDDNCDGQGRLIVKVTFKTDGVKDYFYDPTFYFAGTLDQASARDEPVVASSSGLGSGATAGIVVGVVVAVLLAAAVVIIKRRTADTADEEKPAAPPPAPVERLVHI